MLLPDFQSVARPSSAGTWSYVLSIAEKITWDPRLEQEVPKLVLQCLSNGLSF